MLATVTDKGQVTVPKEIRDRAGIAPGSKLDFQIQDDGSLHVRVLARGARNLFGLLQEPARPPLSIEEMDAGIAEAARTRNLPSSA
ncbi:Transcriptional regulator, AbrB family protein [Candidatus Accumulibacter aalborgensis]|uniref:Transcriptional regulator, AbrB family protein n=1 Tax=Candidatus Accumulibacter aalborgensis TaxID=1860102 RepID=A0A1A8XL93_9PROT|nr:AbrB/MazE/SpoVT family DNA-binding domain-containing protein [Candidatus Accumulibacter aalborgensis]SBT05915.1 Transcriptional regulator, AbrB family protein [Candidatus Accumulibacter aalborgensis]